jgi:hypothetical protein
LPVGCTPENTRSLNAMPEPSPVAPPNGMTRGAGASPA